MVLIDTSIWIEYFKGNEIASPINNLIETNSICTNNIILSELLPSINQKYEYELADLLRSIYNLELFIDWENIILMQTLNLKNGINKVGLPDLIIAQSAIKFNVALFTVDTHFTLMSSLHNFKLYKE